MAYPLAVADEELDDLGVVTTRQVLDGDEAVALVIHDSEGDWQFLHHSLVPLSEEDARIVHISHLFALDPSLEALGSLPEGSAASRQSRDDPWEITEYTDEP